MTIPAHSYCSCSDCEVRPEGLEPPTTWFEARYSVQLSYGRKKKADGFLHQPLGRVVGFEPTIFWATTRRVNPYTTPAMHAA